MHHLVVDIGNSSVKLAVFKGVHLLHKSITAEPEPELLLQLIKDFEVKKSILSAVRPAVSATEELLKTHTKFIRFNHQTSLPIINHYQSRETLGLDRLAGLMGARHFFPHQRVLVIDAGTCITYDLLDQQEQYFGGSISPGIQLRLQSLHHFTGKLPLVAFDTDFQLLEGRNTQESILAGVLNGVLAEVQGVIEKYWQKYSEMQIVLCGGDAHFFDTRLKNSIFARSVCLKPDLVLIGLNEIILHQHD